MIRRNFFANVLGRFVQVVLSFLSVPIYIHLLGVEAYGLIGFFISCQALFLLFDLGIGGTLAREMALCSVDKESQVRASETLRTLEVVYMGLSLLAGGVFSLCVFCLGSYWFQPVELPQNTIVVCLYLMVVALVFQLPISLYNSGLIGFQRLVLLNISNVSFMTLRIVGSIFLIWFFAGDLHVFFTWQIASNILQVLFLRYVLWFDLPAVGVRYFNWGLLSKLWKYAAGLSASGVIVVLLGQIDKIFLSTLLPLHYFGYYMLANTLAQALTLLAAPLGDVLFPKYTQLYEQGHIQEFKNLYLKSFELLMVIVLPFTGILFFYSEDVLHLWVGNNIDIQTTSLMVSILVLGIVMNVAISTLDSVQMAMGSLKASLVVRSVALGLALPVFYLCIHFFGLYGGSIGWGIIYGLYFLWLPHLVLKDFLLDTKYDWYKIFLKNIFISMVVPFFFFSVVQLDWIDSSILKFLTIFFAGVVTLMICIGCSRVARTLIFDVLLSGYAYLRKSWKIFV